MVTIFGYVERESPTGLEKAPKEFSDETEKACFLKIQRYNTHAYYSTNNGFVPWFKFNDKEQERRFRSFDKASQ